MTALFWLPHDPDWQAGLKAITAAAPEVRWPMAQKLANSQLGFLETIQLDRVGQRYFGAEKPAGLATKPVRLAILSSSTVDHMTPALRVGALRRGLWLTTYTSDYGQYVQELFNPASGLYAFAPTAVLFAFDAAHLLGGISSAASAEEAEETIHAASKKLSELWSKTKAAFGCDIYQQTILPRQPPLLGGNEHRLPGSLLRLVQQMNHRLRDLADQEGVHLLTIDEQVATQGLQTWHDPVYWHKAKQEIMPAATPLYGDLMGRLLAAAQGRSYKCLVLDLDNTLWSGVIGDDGVEGIRLGQGSAVGEAYLAIQAYALELSRRGIILAVCSKNDEANALLPFEKHPEMLLKRSDIACFVANWNDKAANLRHIAQSLNIGLDALVFVDDNPFERNIVRRELPMVAVPELPEDPALYVPCIAAAGYFEGLSFTEEDRARSQQYQANIQRENLKTSLTDLGSYLRSLKMEMEARPFDALGLPRIVQLINKTNQFNLTTQRYTEADVTAMMKDPQIFTLQLRLVDQFGDNGMIGVVIGRVDNGDALIDTWLMSCRVLGRGVEQATLNLIVKHAAAVGATRLIGVYKPTAKNGMVGDHYKKLGFQEMPLANQGETQWLLALSQFDVYDTYIQINEAA